MRKMCCWIWRLSCLIHLPTFYPLAMVLFDSTSRPHSTLPMHRICLCKPLSTEIAVAHCGSSVKKSKSSGLKQLQSFSGLLLRVGGVDWPPHQGCLSASTLALQKQPASQAGVALWNQSSDVVLWSQLERQLWLWAEPSRSVQPGSPVASRPSSTRRAFAQHRLVLHYLLT